VRQPLARALVHLPPGGAPLPDGVVEDELNVDAVELIDREGEIVDYELVPNFKVLGPRLGPRVQQLRSALTSVDGPAAAADLAAGRPVVVLLDDGTVELDGTEVELRVRAQPGFAVSRDGVEVVALDLTLDDDLRRRGLAREVIRHIQDVRKSKGLDVSDWIHLHVVGLDDLAGMFELIGREVLARTVIASAPGGDDPGTVVELEDGSEGRTATVWVWRA
jgi:isoleucyl-tRNA synthetase